MDIELEIQSTKRKIENENLDEEDKYSNKSDGSDESDASDFILPIHVRLKKKFIYINTNIHQY